MLLTPPRRTLPPPMWDVFDKRSGADAIVAWDNATRTAHRARCGLKPSWLQVGRGQVGKHALSAWWAMAPGLPKLPNWFLTRCFGLVRMSCAHPCV